MKLVNRTFSNLLARFRDDRRGNITLIFAFASLPLLLTSGIAIDYTRAAMVRGRMAAIADAAVLAATTPAMLSQTATTAQAAAVTMFAAQAALVSGTTYNASNIAVNVNDTTGTNGVIRTVSVSYTGSVANSFSQFEGIALTNFTVSSGVSSSTAPNINFYLLLDTSPSMEIPATTAGINALQNATGCALACHETNYKDDQLNPYPGWGAIDSYTYAENNSITLRIDNVGQAAKDLVTTAQSVMAGNGAVYQMAAYTFSDGVTPIQSLKQTSSANVSSMQSAISAIMPPLMADNNILAAGSTYTYPTSVSAYTTVTLGATTKNSDAGTNFKYALSFVNNAMSTPGNGSKQAGDKPQGVLLIVTDGVDDVALYNSSYCNTIYSSGYSNSYGSFYRCKQPVDTTLCSTVKARGIQIAILYTTYYPLTADTYYNANVAPFISQVRSNLQACASSSNLFSEVSTDGDITAAMKQLFINAITKAPHLIQ